ncbi:MAG TPA: sigma-54 dependent transcriptional regulator [Vicinamibacterales bacterium]
MSVTTPVSDPAARYTPRQRERRLGFAELVASLTRVLDKPASVSMLRGAFEEMVRRIVPVRTVHLRETSSRWSGRREPGDGLESIALEIPGSEKGPPAFLEATLAAGCRLGDWDFQMLGIATHIGALVLEIERNRAQLAKAGLLNGARQQPDGAAPLIGSTTVMRLLRSRIERVAATDFTVLVEGESGVGKELVARQIHDLSRRKNGPFVAINCAALVETLLEAELFGIEERTATGVRGRRGKFEHADGGTLFLDEVSDLSPSAQAKLLRAIQDLAVERVGGNGTHRIDIRIIAATNRSLGGMVEQRLFRPDLYYRLSGVDIRVPTLRERRQDISELANYFLDRHRATKMLTLSAAAAAALEDHQWPGNVRELERLMERAVALAESDVIELDDLPPVVQGGYAALGPALARNDTLRAWSARYARLVLAQSAGNRRKAARMLGISYHTLQAHLRYPIHEAVDAAAAWSATEGAPVGVPEAIEV